MAVADDKLKAAIDETIEPLVADHHKYLANALPDSLAVSRANLHYVYDQYGTQLLDFSNPSQPVGHLHPFVVDALTEHLRFYMNTAAPGEHILRWPVEYARDLVKAFSDPDPDVPNWDLQVLFTEGEQSARVEANKIAQRKTKLGGKTVSLVNHDGLIDRDAVRQAIASRRGDYAVIIDESVTGFGRLGEMWGQQAYGVEADLTVLGGPVGGGLSLGAVIGHRDWFEGYTPTRSPHAGNPLACAAGANLLRAVNPGVVEHAKTAGRAMDAELRTLVDHEDGFPGYVAYTHGMGLYRVLEFQSVGYADQFVLDARRHGLLIAAPPPGVSSIILTPTLIASEQEIRRGVDLMSSVLLEWAEKDGMFTP